jgi:hypothetical protein
MREKTREKSRSLKKTLKELEGKLLKSFPASLRLFEICFKVITPITLRNR